jgi:hypothetical protein
MQTWKTPSSMEGVEVAGTARSENIIIDKG